MFIGFVYSHVLEIASFGNMFSTSFVGVKHFVARAAIKKKYDRKKKKERISPFSHLSLYVVAL